MCGRAACGSEAWCRDRGCNTRRATSAPYQSPPNPGDLKTRQTRTCRGGEEEASPLSLGLAHGPPRVFTTLFGLHPDAGTWGGPDHWAGAGCRGTCRGVVAGLPGGQDRPRPWRRPCRSGLCAWDWCWEEAVLRPPCGSQGPEAPHAEHGRWERAARPAGVTSAWAVWGTEPHLPGFPELQGWTPRVLSHGGNERQAGSLISLRAQSRDTDSQTHQGPRAQRISPACNPRSLSCPSCLWKQAALG